MSPKSPNSPCHRSAPAQVKRLGRLSSRPATVAGSSGSVNAAGTSRWLARQSGPSGDGKSAGDCAARALGKHDIGRNPLRGVEGFAGAIIPPFLPHPYTCQTRRLTMLRSYLAIGLVVFLP